MIYVSNLANDLHASLEAAMHASHHTLSLLIVPAKLWGKNLTTHRSQHLVWTARMEGGGVLEGGSLSLIRFLGTFLAA